MGRMRHAGGGGGWGLHRAWLGAAGCAWRAGAQVPLEDIQGPLDVPEISTGRWLGGLGALLLACVLGWAFRRGWLRRAAAPAGAGEDPDVRALRRLRTAWTRIGEPGEYVVLVSDAVRQYLEEAFGLRAPERTTEEFLEELRAGDSLSDEHRELLAGFLQRCDLVKFAPHDPTTEELRQMYEAAGRLVTETAVSVRAPGPPGEVGR